MKPFRHCGVSVTAPAARRNGTRRRNREKPTELADAHRKETHFDCENKYSSREVRNRDLKGVRVMASRRISICFQPSGRSCVSNVNSCSGTSLKFMGIVIGHNLNVNGFYVGVVGIVMIGGSGFNVDTKDGE